MANLAADHDPVARAHPRLDETAPEPGHLNVPGLVAEGDIGAVCLGRRNDATEPHVDRKARAANALRPWGQDLDALDLQPSACQASVRHQHEISNLGQLAEVVVAPWQVE